MKDDGWMRLERGRGGVIDYLVFVFFGSDFFDFFGCKEAWMSWTMYGGVFVAPCAWAVLGIYPCCTNQSIYQSLSLSLPSKGGADFLFPNDERARFI